jgi:hypothetical protein
MECLDEATVLGLAAGTLDAEGRTRALEHVARCEGCRELVAETAKSLGTSAETRPAEMLEEGATIGRYRLLTRIGAGAMGVVYAAYDTVLGRRVALKFLQTRSLEVDEGEPFPARLAREARSMARLSHPNVVGVYDLGEHDGRLFVAMELVEGPTLTEWLRSGRSVRAILDVIIGAGRGLAAAHARGVVHRDFKPDNILVAADGRARVTDFGLARALDDIASVPGRATGPVGTSVVTRAGSIVGTPFYMAPEQLRGRAASDRSDQWSFAVVLYEALCGERPFDGDTLTALAQSIEEGRLRPFRRGTGVPRRVEHALLRALRARPEARFESMAAMLRALEPTQHVKRRLFVAAALVALAAAVLVSVMSVRAKNAPTHLRECRGFADVCGPNEFCHYTRSNVCGAVEEPGVCWPRPTTCPPTERLACGCDGKTYVSACRTNRDGVSSAYAGPCIPCDRQSGEACGTVMSAGEPDPTYCRYDDEDRCGDSGSQGVCAPRPRACPTIDAPVCGCDRRDYRSGCEAHRAGVGVLHDGRCDT